jgi:hypothetical protein
MHAKRQTIISYLAVGPPVVSFIIALKNITPPHRKQACFESKRDSKMTKINFPKAHIAEL